MINEAIWIIDDDTDDHDLVKDVCRELGLKNKLVFLTGATQALEKLKKISVAPFIIICDVNLPQIDGFSLREKMLADPSKKMHSVPFIFWSTSASEQQITKAYALSAHGFFIKEHSYQELKASFAGIINYWRKSKMPEKAGK
ncbi:MAG: response regulator [Chitinophagaceae bacterium]|nr:response regulator [Chitinophagaceae bacterium]